TTLATFNGSDSRSPTGSLILDSSGILYGTTSGGPINGGTLFAVSKSASPNTVISDNAPQPTDRSFLYGVSDDSNSVVFISSSPIVPNLSTLSKGEGSGAKSRQDVFLLDQKNGSATLVSHVSGSASNTGDDGTPDGNAAQVVAMSGDGNLV